MEKDFTDWNRLKAELHEEHNAPTFRQREIWWGCIGVNVGYEMDGKSKHFSRPVLIVRKFNQRFFYGIPLTTKVKESPYYFQLQFQGKQICAVLSQARAFDAKRLTDAMGKLPEAEFERVRTALTAMLSR